MFTCSYAHATTYYMSTTGNDNNDGLGTGDDNAWATFSASFPKMSSGDTLNVLAGTYSQDINSDDNIPSGTSWSTATTIQTYNDEVVTLNPSTERCISLGFKGNKYIIIEGFICDGVNNSHMPVWIKGDASTPTTFIRLQNIEAKNSGESGFLMSNYTENLELIDCVAHNTLDSGFYISSNNSLFDGCIGYDNTFSRGFLIYATTAGITYNNTIRNGFFYDNERGIGISSGTDHNVYNNVCYNNTDWGIKLEKARQEAYNNTCYNNGGNGIEIDSNASDAIVRNNILYSNGTALVDNGSNTTADHNPTSNPTFVNAADPNGADNIYGTADDGLHIQSGSTAQDAALSSVGGLFTDDLLGVDRDTYAPWDIGAYEIGEVSTPDTTPPSAISLLAGVADSQSQITLTWVQATDDIGVTLNRIYQGVDTNQIAQIGSNTTYAVTGLTENTSYNHWVSAVDQADNEGAKVGTSTTTLGDTTKPSVSSVAATTSTQVTVTFSEDVEITTAETSSNYVITGDSVTVNAAVQQVDVSKVILTTTALVPGITYTLTTNNVQDLSANVMDEDTDNFEIAGGVTTGLIAWYTLDNDTQTPLDSIGTSTAIVGTTTAVEESDPVWTFDGKVGGCFDFNGSTDFISITSNYPLNNMTAFTLMAWINVEGWGGFGFGRILSKEGGAQDNTFLHVQESSQGSIGSEVISSDLNDWLTDVNDAGGIIDFNIWIHITMTYDDAGDKKCHFYVNGEEILLYDNQEALVGTILLDTDDWAIGNKNPPNSTGFEGRIDEVKIWNEAITEAEILIQYNNDIAVDAAIPNSIKGTIFGTMK